MIQKNYFLDAFSKKVSQKILAVAFLAFNTVMAADAYGQPQYADELKVSGQCTLCHTSQEGGRDTVKPAAFQAWQKGGVIPGLRDYLKNLAGNAKPVLLPVDTQWNVQVGEVPLTIPLIVKDKEADNFAMELTNTANPLAPKGYRFSKKYSIPSTNRPAINFIWKPKAAQKNKNYKATFRAKETTASGATQLSNTVNTSIFVWPARPASAKNVISQFNIDSAKWAAKKLTMAGRLVFKKTAATAAKAAALRSLRLNIKSNNGVVVGLPVLLKPSASGAWISTFTLTATQVPCLVKAKYEKLMAARTVKSAPATCKK
ncbi:hypothetical protein [Crenothrix sp.]|uniref:hypothetical protein n=1 Tax=Crenothrix sp. TaxID=3100433 RepID=UPI00374C8E85